MAAFHMKLLYTPCYDLPVHKVCTGRCDGDDASNIIDCNFVGDRYFGCCFKTGMQNNHVFRKSTKEKYRLIKLHDRI